MQIKNQDYLAIIFIAIINTLIFGFLPDPGSNIIAGDDYVPELNPTIFFQKGYYIWSGEYGGLYYYPSLLRWVFNLWFYIGDLSNISTGYIQMLIYYVFFVCGEIGIYLFLRKILNIDPIYALIGANLYLLNPYSIYLFRSGFYAQLYTIAFLPWILLSIYFWIKNNDFRYFLISQILLIISSPVAVNIPAYVILIIFIMLYIIFYVRLFEYGKFFLMKKIFFFMTVTILLNLWWMIFVPYQITMSEEASFDMSVMKWASVESNLPNLFRFLGGWDLTGEFGTSFNPWAHIYESFPLNVLLFIPSILAFIYLIMMKFDNKRSKGLKIMILSNVLIASLLLFIIKRYNPPFPEFTVELYSTVPFLWSFRTADVKLMPFVIFIFSILFALSLDTMNRLKVKNIIKKICLIGVLVTLLLSSYPFYSGKAIVSEGLYYENISHIIKVPKDFEDFSDYYYLNIDNKDNILFLPPNPWYKVWYTWGLHGVDIYHSILPFADAYYILPHDKSWSYGEYSIKPKNTMEYVSNRLYWDILNGEELSLDTFRILGIKYIVYRNDLYTKQPGWDMKIENIDYEDKLSEFNTTKRSFGNITLYELNYNISKFFVYGRGDAKFQNYSKYNPTYYKVKINASKPFILAFTQSYDPLWIAKIGNNAYEPFPLESVINGFVIRDTGDLDIIVEYLPQKWFYYGTVVSLITIIILIIYLIKTRLIKTRNSIKKV